MKGSSVNVLSFVKSSASIHEIKMDLVRTAIPLMDWRQDGKDVIMDIGCGHGDLTRDKILAACPLVKKLIAFDINPAMIEHAKANFSHPKINYCTADLCDWSTLKRWQGTAVNAFSIYTVNWAKDQLLCLQNTFRLLPAGGAAGFQIALYLPQWGLMQRIAIESKWLKYIQNVDTCIPELYFKGYGAKEYERALKNIGFDVLVCKDKEVSAYYDDESVCKDMVAALCAFTDHIPESKREEFKEDLYRRYEVMNPRRDDSGRKQFAFDSLNVVAKKPRI